jgi:tight adherence protein C
MTPLLILSIAGIFASVVLVTFAVSTLLTPGSIAGRRLRQVTKSTPAVILPEVLPLQTDNQGGSWAGVAKFVPKSPEEMGRLRNRLLRAGIKEPSAPIVFSLAEIVLPLILVVPPLLFLQGGYRWFGVAIGAAIGFLSPGLLIDRRIRMRQRQIDDGLPDALDLLVVCIEAGSGLDQAILKTADELALAYPILAEELRQVNVEIRAGKSRLEAFKNLAQRTKVDSVRSLTAMLIQTDRFGTSVGQALRVHADTSRTKRRQRAEEAAQKIGVKLVFPLVLCFFPAFYVIVLGAAVVQFVRSFM